MPTPVPKFTFLVSARRRLQFTTNLLPTAVRGATRDHDYLVVLDRGSLEHEFARRPGDYPPEAQEKLRVEDAAGIARVDQWFADHQDLCARSGVRVAHHDGGPACWTGGLRSAGAMNHGIANSDSEYLVAFGDEDLCLRPGWDEALWRALDNRDPLKFVSLPTVVKMAEYDAIPPKMSSLWIHEQRKVCCHALSFPVRRGVASATHRITAETWDAFAKLARLHGVYEEPCALRRMCHWVPMLVHRRLLEHVGGWRIQDERAYNYDIALDDELGRNGIRKRMPLGHAILDSKLHYFISDEVDQEWGHAPLIASLAGAVKI
jgi:hypothetical protein